MIDLISILEGLENYVIVRIAKEFPQFNIGKDDVDILCKNKDETAIFINNALKRLYPQFHCKTIYIQGKIHLDAFHGSQFILKFDISDSVKKEYNLFDVPNEFTEEIINNFEIHPTGCRIPSLQFEMAMRKMEHDTYVDIRPEKIKHMKFIQQYPEIIYPQFSKI